MQPGQQERHAAGSGGGTGASSGRRQRWRRRTGWAVRLRRKQEASRSDVELVTAVQQGVRPSRNKALLNFARFWRAARSARTC